MGPLLRGVRGRYRAARRPDKGPPRARAVVANRLQLCHLGARISVLKEGDIAQRRAWIMTGGCRMN